MKARARARRIVVIGSSCAGKTTFATRLAGKLGLKHIELDALHWEPGWKEAEVATFRTRVAEAVAGDAWVVDGNYTSRVKDLVWPRADTLVWLDPPLRTILARFLVRSFSRSFRGEMLWGHSRESLRNSIFSRKSLLVWIVSTHKRRTRASEALLENPPAGLAVHRLAEEAQIEAFISASS